MIRNLFVLFIFAAASFSKANAQSTKEQTNPKTRSPNTKTRCSGTSSPTPKDTLSFYRARIDTLDSQIVDLLGKRMSAARAIGIYKMDHHIGVVQSTRFDEVLQNAIKHGMDVRLSEDFIRALYNDIHTESIRQQEELKQTHQSH